MRNKIRPMRLANVSAGAAARVRLALLLTAIVLVVEVVGGLWAHSLALLSDAGHIVTDLVVLALSSFALGQAQRPASARRTFGYQRVGILVAAVKRVPGVNDLHDLHIWSLGAQTRAMSAHLLIDDQRVTQAQDILAEVREVLAHEFEIEHTTIQFESLVCRPGDVFCVQPDGHPHLDDAHDRMTRRATG